MRRAEAVKTALLAAGLAILCLGVSLGQAAPVDAQGNFQVIVHPSVSVERMGASELSDLFLKKAERWPDGTRAFPVDQVETSQVRESFTRSVHGRSVAAIKAFWQQRIFSGRDVPPPEKTSDREVVDLVRATPGAVGYVSTATVVQGAQTLRVDG